MGCTSGYLVNVPAAGTQDVQTAGAPLLIVGTANITIQPSMDGIAFADAFAPPTWPIVAKVIRVANAGVAAEDVWFQPPPE